MPAKWFKNGVELQPSDVVAIEMEGKVHHLVLKDTQVDDSAEYTVVIKDKSSSAKLTVEGQCVCEMYISVRLHCSPFLIDVGSSPQSVLLKFNFKYVVKL